MKKKKTRAGALRKANPFADLAAAHVEIARREELVPYPTRVKDWTQVKQSTSGSTSRKGKVTLSWPGEGTSVQI